MSESNQLIIEKYGAFVGKHSERVRVYLKGEIVEERPFHGLEHLLILSGGVSLSSDLVRECAERGIPISFISRDGKPYAKIISPELTGTIKTRREQLMAYLDSRGVMLAKSFAVGKVSNQSVLLKYMAKYRKVTDAELYEKVREAAFQLEDCVRRINEIEGEQVESIRQSLMNLEGYAAKIYWDAARELIIPAVSWEGRETRGAQDLVNSALNYGYGILYTQVERALVLAGLDPYAGFVHVDRPGKPSLVLDLVEEFRQAVVDRTVYALLNKGVKLEIDDGKLTEASRRTIAEKVNERLEGDEPYEGKKHKLRTIIQSQARHMATFLRGEGKEYKPFVGRW
ncbi:MAG: CRISPR-associated endonuclease Cas1 [Chloroflexi bacterium]|nr:CRISPR-associated endonuclease Cas1 [Chloroflexota bacterium]